MAPAAKGTARLLLVASVALIVAATTMPWSAYYVGHSHWARVEWVPFTQRVRPLDFLLNILLFVPFGFTAQTAGQRVQRVVLAATLLSAGVEVFQVYTHGRLPTTTDVLSNATGAFLGARWAATRIAHGDRA